VGFADAVKTCLRQYGTFTGRARRSEYWFFTLAHFLVLAALYVVVLVVGAATGALSGATDSTAAGAGGGIVMLLLTLVMCVVALGLFVPTLAVTVRRLHDTGRSGWWYLISLVPFGGIVILVFSCLDSTPGPNQFGPNPKGIGGYGPQSYQQFPPAGGYGNQSGYGNQPGYGNPQGF
jgi:uncharacterized membrane protein YhaH (DUF805 family)